MSQHPSSPRLRLTRSVRGQEGPTGPPPGICALLGVYALVTLVSSTAWAGDWAHIRGGADGSNRGAAGGFTPTGSGRPGIIELIAAEQGRLGPTLLHDVDGDGVAESLILYRGSVAAFRPTTGSFAWVSLPAGLDTLIGIQDVDGDGIEELVATSADLNGGLYFFDLVGGGLIGSVGGFPERSGINSAEVVFYDLDGDGRNEIVCPPGTNGLDFLAVISLAAGLGQPSTLLATFAGYSVLTPARVGRFTAEGGVGIVLNQGSYFSLFEVCSGGDDASCDPGGSGVCLCPRPQISGVHGSYAFGSAWVVDVDEDGIDEILEAPSSSYYTGAVALFDLRDAFGGTGTGASSRRWYWQYSGHGESTLLAPDSSGPTDLDGDGDLDLLVNFANNVALETDAAGAPTDDGIDLPGGISFAVFDLTSGLPILVAEDQFAYGVADLDGNGLAEVITSPTSGWNFTDGLVGSDLVCGLTDCVLQFAWAAPELRLIPNPSSLSGSALPQATIPVVGIAGDRAIAYRGGDVVVFGPDGNGGVVVVAGVTLGEYETVAASGLGNELILLADREQVHAFDDDLVPLADPVPLPRQGLSPALAVADGDGVAHLVMEGRVRMELSEAGAEEIGDTGGGVLFGEDLDLDGEPEFISSRDPSPADGTGVVLAAHSIASSGSALDLRWSTDLATIPDLLGARMDGSMHIASAQIDADPPREVVVSMRRGTENFVAAFDGSTGAYEGRSPAGEYATGFTPIRARDVGSPDGSLTPDGLDDVLVPGPYHVEAVSFGGTAPLYSVTTGSAHWVGLWADLDGDGDEDLLTTKSDTITNDIDAMDVSGVPFHLWGPQPLGRASGRTQVLTVVAVDSGPGTDVVYATGDGSLEAVDGATGTALPSFPVYFGGGTLDVTPPAVPVIPGGLIAMDVDGDGFDEVVVGTNGGEVAAIRVNSADVAAPELEWSVSVGAPVLALAAADVDGDGLDEILVSTAHAELVVLAPGGGSLSITSPGDGACATQSDQEISGTADGANAVHVHNVGLPGEVVPVVGGAWVGVVHLVGIGAHLVVAEALDDLGEVLAVAGVVVQFDGDPDGDGVTECGGDCAPDQGAIYPGATDGCEDGVDSNCDGTDPDCPPDPTPAGDDDSAVEGPEPTPIDEDPPGGGCGDCGVGGEPGTLSVGGFWWGIGLLPLALRRRAARR